MSFPFTFTSISCAWLLCFLARLPLSIFFLLSGRLPNAPQKFSCQPRISARTTGRRRKYLSFRFRLLRCNVRCRFFHRSSPLLQAILHSGRISHFWGLHSHERNTGIQAFCMCLSFRNVMFHLFWLCQPSAPACPRFSLFQDFPKQFSRRLSRRNSSSSDDDRELWGSYERMEYAGIKRLVRRTGFSYPFWMHGDFFLYLSFSIERFSFLKEKGSPVSRAWQARILPLDYQRVAI